MNDQRFFDLTMKVIARQCTEVERNELDALLSAHPELRTEFERLRGEARLAKDVLPLAAAAESTSDEFPGYARERLQTKVRQTLGPDAPAVRRKGWSWRWFLVLAGATAVILILALPSTKNTAPVVEIAMLDTAGSTRGGNTNDTRVLHQHWQSSEVRNFDRAADLATWEAHWPQRAGPTVKVIYDRNAAEIRVLIRVNGRTESESFVVEKDLTATLSQARSYIATRIDR